MTVAEMIGMSHIGALINNENRIFGNTIPYIQEGIRNPKEYWLVELGIGGRLGI